MSTPRSGRKMMKSVQPVFARPEMSWRLNTSISIVITSQNHIIQAKKMIIVQKMSRNG
jgi:hypothetical protein